MRAQGTQMTMDYTAVPAGIRIVGQLWTGQPTGFTAICPKCGRIGVKSSPQSHQSIIVHTGRTNGQTLAAIDFCNLQLNEDEICSSISGDDD